MVTHKWRELNEVQKGEQSQTRDKAYRKLTKATEEKQNKNFLICPTKLIIPR